MKKSISIALLLLSLVAQAQQIKTPYASKKIALVAGPYTQLNFADYAEFGTLAGVNFKDIALLGLFHQTSIQGNHFTGLYTQFNFNPKFRNIHFGYVLRTGIVNGKFISQERGVTLQSISKNGKYKIIHRIGLVAKLPSYNIGIIFGNFGPKYWKKPRRY